MDLTASKTHVSNPKVIYGISVTGIKDACVEPEGAATHEQGTETGYYYGSPAGEGTRDPVRKVFTAAEPIMGGATRRSTVSEVGIQGSCSPHTHGPPLSYFTKSDFGIHGDKDAPLTTVSYRSKLSVTSGP